VDYMSVLVWLQLIFVVPVSFSDDLSALLVFNVLGNTFILGAVIILSAVTLHGLASEGVAEDVTLNGPPQQLVIFAGFSVYAFEGINMVIPMYSAHRNKDNFKGILSTTIIGIMVLFSAFSSANILLYGDEVKPILTLNLQPGSVFVFWIPFLFAVASLVLVVLMAFPTFEIIENRVRLVAKGAMDSHVSVCALRASLMALCALAAQIGGATLDTFLALVGAIGCVPLAFMYPALVHLRLVARTRSQKAVDCLLFVFGVALMISCVSTTVHNAVAQ